MNGKGITKSLALHVSAFKVVKKFNCQAKNVTALWLQLTATSLGKGTGTQFWRQYVPSASKFLRKNILGSIDVSIHFEEFEVFQWALNIFLKNHWGFCLGASPLQSADGLLHGREGLQLQGSEIFRPTVELLDNFEVQGRRSSLE